LSKKLVYSPVFDDAINKQEMIHTIIPEFLFNAHHCKPSGSKNREAEIDNSTTEKSTEDIIQVINLFSDREAAKLHQGLDSVLVRNYRELSILGRIRLHHPSVEEFEESLECARVDVFDAHSTSFSFLHPTFKHGSKNGAADREEGTVRTESLFSDEELDVSHLPVDGGSPDFLDPGGVD